MIDFAALHRRLYENLFMAIPPHQRRLNMPGPESSNEGYEKQRAPGPFGDHKNPQPSDLKRGFTDGSKFNGSVTDGDKDAGKPTEG